MSAYAKASPLNEDVTSGERETFRAWARQIFGDTPVARQFEWSKEATYQVVVYEGKDPVGYLKIVERTCLLDDRPVRIGGVGGVMTPPQHRRKGYAGLALREARGVIFEKLRAQLGLLLCLRELVPFYARHGWQTVDCAVRFEQPSGSTVWPHCAMILAGAGEGWKPKSIDLCGLPW